jgi:hypothetical protein
MEIVKAYQVLVKAYTLLVVSKHTKIYMTENEANAYKTHLENNVVWNTPVIVSVVPVYLISDDGNYQLLSAKSVIITST